jgi:tetratricopeptide (TPR) repeat protein
VALALFGVLLSPWLARRWATDALAATSPSKAITLANRAHALDPLLVEPFWAKAYALDARGRPRAAFEQFLAAVRRQPANPQTWLAAGEYAKERGCPYLEYTYLLRYTELDRNARASEGADDYRDALDKVDHRQYTC